MGIGKLIYEDLPKVFSAVRHLRSISTIRSRGLTFKLVSDNRITKYRASSFNEKEPEMLDWLDDNLQDGDMFFDVGANVGIYSIYAALRKPTATIYAFEPEYSNLHQLKMNIINNDLLKNVIPFAIAISDQTGVSYLHIHEFTPGAALSTERRDSINKTYGKDVVWKEGIVTSTLDYISEIKDEILAQLDESLQKKYTRELERYKKTKPIKRKTMKFGMKLLSSSPSWASDRILTFYLNKIRRGRSN